MLKTETVNKIAVLLKVKPEDLATAIKDEKEIDVAIDDKITTYTEDEIGTVKNNEYKRGKQVGVEMEIKEAREKMGLDFNGKTITGLLEAHSKKVLEDAKIEPEKKVTELQEKVNNLQSTVKDYETKISDKDKEVIGVKINGELRKHIPANATLEPDEIITLMGFKGYEFKMVEGKVVAMKDGKEVQDKLSNALPVKDVISGFVTERKFVPDEKQTPGGRGKGDEKGATTFTKLSEIKEKFAAEGKNMLGTEFSEAVAEAAKVKEFDMNS